MAKLQRVVVDSKQPLWFRYLIKQAYPEAVVLNLGVHSGDLLFQLEAKLVAIEVKEVPGDLVASITDRRLFEQAEGMRRETPWSFLLLSQDLHYDDEHRLLGVGSEGYGPLGSWTRDHIDGALTAVQARGVMVRVAYRGYLEAIRLILNWVERADRGSVTQELIKLSPFDEHDQKAVNLLAWFEGVGAAQAKHFMDWAGKRTPIEYLRLATTPFNHDKPAGWTGERIRRNREQLGLGPNEQIGLLRIPEWSELLDEA